MMIKKSLFLLICGSLLWAANLDAFLDNGIGIQGPSMGGANFRSVGIESAWSAPSRLALVRQSQIALVINKKWDFLEESWLGAAIPLFSGVMGVQYFNSRSGESILGTIYDSQTGKNQYTGLGYNYYASLIQLTYADTWKPDTRWALALRMQNKVLGPISASSIGLDVATDWDLMPQLNASLKVSNLFATPYQWVSENEQPSLGWITGLGYQVNPHWTLNGGFQSVGSDLKWMVGTEYVIDRSLYLRAGANRDELSAGIGLQLENIGIDYGFQYILTGEGLMNSVHRMGVSWGFDSAPVEKIPDAALIESDIVPAQDVTMKTIEDVIMAPVSQTISAVSEVAWSNQKWSIQGLAKGVSQLDQNESKIVIRPDHKFFYKGALTGPVKLTYTLENGDVLKIRIKAVNETLRIEGVSNLSLPVLVNNRQLVTDSKGRFLITLPLIKGEQKFQIGIGL